MLDIYNKCAARGFGHAPPQRNDRTTKPKRRACIGNAAEPLGVCSICAMRKPKRVARGQCGRPLRYAQAVSEPCGEIAMCRIVLIVIFKVNIRYYLLRRATHQEAYLHHEKSTDYSVHFSGGDKRVRTADLLNAIQALYQLSYTPKGIVSVLLT